jgi:hypothetical protein
MLPGFTAMSISALFALALLACSRFGDEVLWVFGLHGAWANGAQAGVPVLLKNGMTCHSVLELFGSGLRKFICSSKHGTYTIDTF